MADWLSAANYQTRVKFASDVVRGLEYYTGPVFETELTFDVPNEKGEPVVFGSIGGGGRYDGLVGRFRGELAPATGFSIGVSPLTAAPKSGRSPNIPEGGRPRPLLLTPPHPPRLPPYQHHAAAPPAARLR